MLESKLAMKMLMLSEISISRFWCICPAGSQI